MRGRISLLLVLVLCVPWGNARELSAQGQDTLIAGKHLERIWFWLTTKKVQIRDPELRSHIEDLTLSAILVPKDQAEGAYRVRLCYQEKSSFDVPDHPVPKADVETLLRYAKDGVYPVAADLRESLRQGRQGNTAGLERATARLQTELGALPAADREASERFAGALLADVDPAAPVLQNYVKEYRNFIEKGALASLRSPGVGELLVIGQAYVVGGTSLTGLDLAKIDPSKVEKVEVDKRIYRKAWVGSNLVLVPQAAPDAEAPVRPPDATGLGLVWKAYDFSVKLQTVKELENKASLAIVE